jgi:hypothetical protein
MIGLGISYGNGSYHGTAGSSFGAVLRSKGGDLNIYTGVGNNMISPTSRISIKNDGKIGIGTENPSQKLEVKNGNVSVNNGNIKVLDGDMLVSSGRILVANSSGKQFEVKSNGYVVAREILVDIDEMIPDYVFDEDYDLMELTELRTYLDENHHLPNIPSASEFEDQGGIELGELTRLLLEKQEEMVLYILDLENRIETLNEKIN